MNKTCPQCKNSLDISAFGWDLDKKVCNGCWSFNQAHSPKEEEWEDIKAKLYEMDEMEFAGSRDALFEDVDNILSKLKQESYKKGKEDGFAEEGIRCHEHCEETRLKVIEETLALIPEESADFKYLSKDVAEFARQLRDLLTKIKR